MTLRLVLRASFLAAVTMASASVATGQATRTWVSGVGDDVNPCSRTAPCKTFAGALMKTAKGGEIDALDPAGYGAVVITKSITIDGTGTMAGILGSLVNAIIINITDRTDAAQSVRIRGLSLNGVSNGLQGIKVIAASKVFVEDTVIDGFKDGIGVASGGTQVFVRDTSIRNNSGAGITVVSGSRVILSNVSVVFNGTGLAAAPGGDIISFKNNVVYGNGTDGNPTASAVLR
jgi:parallel beta helix pectate lyase-like protein